MATISLIIDDVTKAEAKAVIDALPDGRVEVNTDMGASEEEKPTPKVNPFE